MREIFSLAPLTGGFISFPNSLYLLNFPEGTLLSRVNRDTSTGCGVVPDTCLVMNRRCMSFDMAPDPAARPEIEKWYWDTDNMKWPLDKKTKPDLIIFDPPCFSKKANDYHKESIAGLSKKEYIRFFVRFFSLASERSKKETIITIINADWRDFQGRPAREESWENSILRGSFKTFKFGQDQGRRKL